MTTDRKRRDRATGRGAAGWYVELDAYPNDRERAAALTAWLERSPDHEAAFERCEAAVAIAHELAARGAFDDALVARPAGSREESGEHGRLRRQLRESVHRAAGVRPRLLEWAARPAVAWSVAAIAVMWAVAATVERGAPSGVTGDGARMAGFAASSDLADTAAAAVASSAGIRAESMPRVDVDAEPANESMPVAAAAAAGDHSVSVERWNPIGLLPGEIVVDAQSVAVLPFYGVLGMVEQNPAIQGVGGSPAADRIAMQLHDEVVRQLSLMPGVFVVDGRSSAVYAGGELGADEIAALLGVRGVVAAEVSLDGRIVQVSMKMTDAVNEGRRTETTFERPLDELPAVRTAIVSNIADTLASRAF